MACEGHRCRCGGVLLAAGLLLLASSPTRCEPLSLESELGASLAGLVYCDTNNNAVRDEREVGLAGVKIVLDGTTTEGDLVVIVTQTAADGSFRFDGLSAGTYVLMEEQPERFIQGKPNTPGSAGGESLGPDRFTGIALVAGQQVTGYQFGEWGLKARYISKKWLCHIVPEPTVVCLLLTALVPVYLLLRRAKLTGRRV